MRDARTRTRIYARHAYARLVWSPDPSIHAHAVKRVRVCACIEGSGDRPD